MAGEFLANPAVGGLAGGALIVVAVQLIWTRVMGAPQERTIPAQLSDINARLVEMNLKLELLIAAHKHTEERVKEVTEDFWDHMKTYHGQFKSNRDSGGIGVRRD